jgi:hypothetical protein
MAKKGCGGEVGDAVLAGVALVTDLQFVGAASMVEMTLHGRAST